MFAGSGGIDDSLYAAGFHGIQESIFNLRLFLDEMYDGRTSVSGFL